MSLYTDRKESVSFYNTLSQVYSLNERKGPSISSQFEFLRCVWEDILYFVGIYILFANVYFYDCY